MTHYTTSFNGLHVVHGHVNKRVPLYLIEQKNTNNNGTNNTRFVTTKSYICWCPTYTLKDQHVYRYLPFLYYRIPSMWAMEH